MNGNGQGKLTRKLGEVLTKHFEGKNYRVYYDHGDPANENVGNVVAWIGSEAEPGRETSLAQLDIAIVEKDTERVIVLVEIEESDDRPKTLLGDVFATMMADNIRFKEKKFAVGLWTTLIIKAKRAKFEIERVSRLQEKIDQLLSHLRTEQGWIGKVLLETYSDGDELIKNMTSEIDGLIEG